MADQPGERGFDAGKKVKGRKRHLLVDTLGLILVAVVHSAAIQDREGAKLVIQKARWFGRLRVIFADAAYSGQLVAWVREFFGRQGARLSIVPRLGHGFRLLAKRWIVERTFSLGLPTTVDSPRTTKSKPNIPRPSFMQPQPALCSGALPLRPTNDFFHRF